ncbi:MAG: pilus assembly protein TadG-related protein [Pseudomonadota bacterium]
MTTRAITKWLINSCAITGFLRSKNGNMAMMFGFFAPVLIIALGFAVDFGRASLARTTVQEATDAALLAAARLKTARPDTSQTELDAAAQKFFDAVLGPDSGVVASPVSVTHNPSTNQFSIDLDAHVQSTFMKLAGVEQISLDTDTVVEVAPPGVVEVALVLDVTGSMGDGTKMDDLKEAAGNLVASMYALPETDVKFAVVPFAQYVNIGAGFSSASWLSIPSGGGGGDDDDDDDSGGGFDGCVGSRVYPRNTEDAADSSHPIPGVTVNSSDCQMQPITPLTDNRTTVDNALTALQPAGWTYIPTGLSWGWRVISNPPPFQEGLTTAEVASRSGMKAIVLMTDGRNTRAPNYPEHNSTSVTLANDLTAEICTNIKADGVSLYTIAFDVSDTTIRSILEDCANSASDYYDAQNANQLTAAFDSIGERLRDLSLKR